MEIEILKKKKQQAFKAFEKYKKLKEEVYINCHCPESELVGKSDYFGGGYNDTAYTDYWDECVICGRYHNKRTKDHGYYG